MSRPEHGVRRMRLAFEVRRRVLVRLGNAHDPLSEYALRVFPWQDLDGRPLAAGTPKTKPRLRSTAT